MGAFALPKKIRRKLLLRHSFRVQGVPRSSSRFKGYADPETQRGDPETPREGNGRGVRALT